MSFMLKNTKTITILKNNQKSINFEPNLKFSVGPHCYNGRVQDILQTHLNYQSARERQFADLSLNEKLNKGRSKDPMPNHIKFELCILIIFLLYSMKLKSYPDRKGLKVANDWPGRDQQVGQLKTSHFYSQIHTDGEATK